MSQLKGFWKQTAKSFILAFNDLGVSIAESAKVGVDKVVEWARKDNIHYEAEGVEVPTPEEEVVAEEPAKEAEPEQPAEAVEPEQPAEEAQPEASTEPAAE